MPSHPRSRAPGKPDERRFRSANRPSHRNERPNGQAMTFAFCLLSFFPGSGAGEGVFPENMRHFQEIDHSCRIPTGRAFQSPRIPAGLGQAIRDADRRKGLDPPRWSLLQQATRSFQMAQAVSTPRTATRTVARRKSLGQGMTEYIVIVALVGVAAIGVYSFLGQSVRGATAGIALELAGEKRMKASPQPRAPVRRRSMLPRRRPRSTTTTATTTDGRERGFGHPVFPCPHGSSDKGRGCIGQDRRLVLAEAAPL